MSLNRLVNTIVSITVLSGLLSSLCASENAYPKEELFESWDGNYQLMNGSRACKSGLEISYVNNPSTKSNYLNATSENYQDYPLYLIEELPADNFSQLIETQKVFRVIRKMYGLQESQDREVEHIYTINDFTNRIIDMDVEFGKNEYHMVIRKTRKNQVLLEIEDNASIFNRIKGVADVERIRAQKCRYQIQEN